METQSQREKRKNNKNPLLVSEQTGWAALTGYEALEADATSYMMEDKKGLIVGNYWHHDGLCRHTSLHSCLLFLAPFPSCFFNH